MMGLGSARLLAVSAAVAALCGSTSAQQASVGRGTVASPPPVASPVRSLSGFVANGGQWDDEVLFFAREAGIEATVTRDALVLTPQRIPRGEGEDGSGVDIGVDTSRPAPVVLRMPGLATSVDGEGALPTAYHFLRGERSASHVTSYAQVVYRDVVGMCSHPATNATNGLRIVVTP